MNDNDNNQSQKPILGGGGLRVNSLGVKNKMSYSRGQKRSSGRRPVTRRRRRPSAAVTTQG